MYVIFVLGGGVEREEFAAHFALLYPNLEVWISGGMPQNYSLEIFKKYGVNGNRISFLPATNTVENFSLAVSKMRQNAVSHVFVISSDYHLPRAILIAKIILMGIKIIPIPVFPKWSHPPEPWHKLWRDFGRSLYVVIFGKRG